MKVKVIAQVLYYFKENWIAVKQFLRTVDKETDKTYQVWATDEVFKKSEENTPVVLYGNTVSLWKVRELDVEVKQNMSNEEYEILRQNMVDELIHDLKDYLVTRILTACKKGKIDNEKI